MSKMRLKPATIGVVRSCAMPHAVKHAISAMNSDHHALAEQRLALRLLRLLGDGLPGDAAHGLTLPGSARRYIQTLPRSRRQAPAS